MKHTIILLISALLFCCPVDAQERVIDSTDRSPISAASIFDAMVSANCQIWWVKR